MINNAKLLMVASDYVNGISLNNIILNSDLKIFKKITVLTAFPSSNIIIKKKFINYFQIENSNNNNNNILIKVKNFLDKIKPDIILTGINGPKYNIDEVIINLSKKRNIKTYSIQNFWGDINLKYKNIADKIFVLDKTAKYETKRKINNRAIIKIIGSIDHENYRKLKNNQLDKKSNIKKILFCGQPFLEKKKYQKILFEFLLIIKDYNYEISFRPHPLNSLKLINYIKWEAKELNIKLRIDQNKDIKKTIFSSDFIVSFFSTTNFDAINLMKYIKKFKIIPIYLFYDEEIKKIYQQFTKLKKIPIDQKQAFIIYKKKEILNIFNPKLILFNKNKYKKNIFKKNQLSEKISTKIIYEIYRDTINL